MGAIVDRCGHPGRVGRPVENAAFAFELVEQDHATDAVELSSLKFGQMLAVLARGEHPAHLGGCFLQGGVMMADELVPDERVGENPGGRKDDREHQDIPEGEAEAQCAECRPHSSILRT